MYINKGINMSNTNMNILDQPVTPINKPLLLPKKYKKEKRKYTRGNNIKQKIVKIFDQLARKRGRAKKMRESWYEQLKKTVSDLFNTQKSVFKLILNKKFKNAVKKYKINTPGYYDPIILFNDVKETIFKKIREEKSSKVRLSMHCLMVKTDDATGKETRKDPHFSSKQETILEGTDLEETYENMIVKIIDSMEKWKDESSKWRLEKIIKIGVIHK